MSEKMRESLSALMDNEADELELQRLLRQVGDDGELRQAWVRYNAARDIMQGRAVAHLELDISSRVRDAISHDARPGLRERLLRPVASFAVAASVAATVVIGGQQLAQISTAEDPYGSQAAAAGSASPVGLVNTLGAMPVQASYGTQLVPELKPTDSGGYERLARQRLNKYMQEHAEHAALNSPQGLMPFARVPEIRE